MMKSIFEELGGTYTIGDDGMLYPDYATVTRPASHWKMGQECI